MKPFIFSIPPAVSLFALLVAAGFEDFANAVMQVTNESRDGRVNGTAICFDIAHSAPLNALEKASVTNTSSPLLCELWVKPYVKLNGKAGVVRRIQRSSGELRIVFNATLEVCFDFQAELAELSNAPGHTVDLLGVGEMETACAPEVQPSAMPTARVHVKRL